MESPWLEAVLDAELQDPRISRHRLDAPEVARAQVRDRVSPVDVVQQVERLDAQLDVLRAEREEPRDREVHLPEAGPADAVAAMRTELTRRRQREGGAVQVVVQRLVSVNVV